MKLWVIFTDVNLKNINLTFSKSATIRFTVVIVGSRQKSSIFESLKLKIFFSLIVSAVVYFIAGALSHSDHFVLVLSFYGPANQSSSAAVKSLLVSSADCALLSRPV